jgi:SNF2 family DNA or RNA helicase
MDFNVIVLEEGHRIANGESLTAAAAYGLQGRYRMPLTGTPFQNEYSDVQSLFRFLKIAPWDDTNTFNRVSFTGPRRVE